MAKGKVSEILWVPGVPHVLLAAEASPGWSSLRKNYDVLGEQLAASDAEAILYLSTQWLSVLGMMVQGREELSGVHVDENWHRWGAMNYRFRTAQPIARALAEELQGAGVTAKLIDYDGFPIDTGTIVADTLLNPGGRLPVAMLTTNIYAERDETEQMGQLAAAAVARSGMKVAMVVVSGLSHRFHTEEIDPATDRISSAKDDEWNHKVLELFSMGDLDELGDVARSYAGQANADLGFKSAWFLQGLMGRSCRYRSRILDYQPVWGTGAALIQLTPEGEGMRQQRAPAATTKGDGPAGVPAPVGAYPYVRRSGDLLFLSGIGPRTEDGTVVAPGGDPVRAQTHRVFTNLKRILGAEGLGLSDVIDVQVFLTDMKTGFPAFNAVYGEYFDAVSGPTRTTVEVGALPTPIAVEFKVVARLPST